MKRENISNYERGTITNISSETLSSLSDLFNVSTDYLLGRTDDLSPTKNSTDNNDEIHFRMKKEGLSSEELKNYVEDIEAYAELRKKLLMEKKKK